MRVYFSLELENCIFISLLEFQDFETKILFLFSICEISKIILSLLDFQDCEDKSLFLLSIHETLFSVSLSLPVRNASYFREKYAFFRVWGGKLFWSEVLGGYLMSEKNLPNQNLNPFFKCKMFGKISLSPLGNYELSISLSLLKIGEQDLTFLFLFSKTEI